MFYYFIITLYIRTTIFELELVNLIKTPYRIKYLNFNE